MNNLVYNDSKKRQTYLKHEIKRLEYTSLFSDLSLPKQIRAQALDLLGRLPRNSSRVRVTNRCILTGRSHAVLRLCKLSRIKFRDLASQGRLMGVQKSSW